MPGRGRGTRYVESRIARAGLRCVVLGELAGGRPRRLAVRAAATGSPIRNGRGDPHARSTATPGPTRRRDPSDRVSVVMTHNARYGHSQMPRSVGEYPSCLAVRRMCCPRRASRVDRVAKDGPPQSLCGNGSAAFVWSAESGTVTLDISFEDAPLASLPSHWLAETFPRCRAPAPRTQPRSTRLHGGNRGPCRRVAGGNFTPRPSQIRT